MRLPMQVYKLAKSGNKTAQAFVNQYGDMEGQYQDGMWEQFKAQAEQAQGGEDKLMAEGLDQDFDKELTPEQAKAQEVIEDYGDKYGVQAPESGSSLNDGSYNQKLAGRFDIIHADMVEQEGKFDLDKAKEQLISEGFNPEEVESWTSEYYDPWEYEDYEFGDDEEIGDDDEYTGREPGGIKGDLERAGFQNTKVIDDKTLEFEGPNGKTWTVKENDILGFDVYDDTGKMVIEDVNANQENVATRILQREQNPMKDFNMDDFNAEEEKEYNIVTLDGENLGTIKAKSEDEAFEKASQANPGLGDELSVEEIKKADDGYFDDYDSDLEDGYKIYKDKISEDISKAKTRKDLEYISEEIDDNLKAGYISQEEANEFKNKLYSFDGRHNILINRMYNSIYDTPEEVLEVAKGYGLSDKEQAALENEVKNVFGIDELPDMSEEAGRQRAIDDIRKITDRINSTDADDPEGYLYSEESNRIKNYAKKYKISSDELKQIGGNVFGPYGYNVEEYGYKEPVENKSDVNKTISDFASGDEYFDWFMKLSDEDKKKHLFSRGK